MAHEGASERVRTRNHQTFFSLPVVQAATLRVGEADGHFERAFGTESFLALRLDLGQFFFRGVPHAHLEGPEARVDGPLGLC